MDIRVGDIVRLKKPHPCGTSTWEVLRIGQDFRLKCTGCGRQVMMRRTCGSFSGRAARKRQPRIRPADGAISGRSGVNVSAPGGPAQKFSAPAV